MSQSFLNGKVTLRTGNCAEVVAAMPDNSVDSVVCDPPYALTSGGRGGFMGKQWDTGDVAFDPTFWAEVLRVVKPGGHVVAFSGTRTYHRLACAIEDAGWEIRDQLAWAYGSGFPKSHDVSKGIDKAAGATREKVRHLPRPESSGTMAGSSDTRPWIEQSRERGYHEVDGPDAVTDAAREWQGWGTALKPAWESICWATKPYTNAQEIRIIGSYILRLWSQLWLMLPASDAAKFSTLSPSVCGADPSAFAQWNAEQRSSTQAALSALMDMSRYELALISSLSTVSSWSATWGELLQAESTSTTETAISQTIDLRTLKSCLSRITPESIILAHKSGAWSIANACTAARIFSASVRRLDSTLELSALESAIEQEAQACRDAGVTPNWEPICLARKPLIGTVAANVLQHGTGAINVDGCRVATDDSLGGGMVSMGRPKVSEGWDRPWMHDKETTDRKKVEAAAKVATAESLGRWPANLVTDGSPEVLAAFPDTNSTVGIKGGTSPNPMSWGGDRADASAVSGYDDSGSAARFFYTAKADADDRLGFKHPTIKPVDLMQWLVRLVTPKGGICLDPFAGTGTTGEAAWREGMRCILIEREPEYQDYIRRRMELAERPAERTATAKAKGVVETAGPLFGDVA